MHISISAEKVFEIGGFPVTNSMLATFAVMLGLAVICIWGTRKMKQCPTGLQNILEMVVEALHKLTHSVVDNKRIANKIFPLIATFFLFVIINNWAGLLPGFGSIGVNEIKEGEKVLVPFFRAGTADLNTTLMLAIVSVIAIQLIGIGVVGMRGYAKKFLNFSSPILFFVGILELMSEFIKVISFSFRLFGNIFAGEVLLLVITSLIPYVIPVPFYGLEIFVGFIQALVFTMLTLVFIKMAMIEAHQ
ncbi:MAG: F0F1 ATP synthase subunit A [Candidatus Saccharibacteria bacterium]